MRNSSDLTPYSTCTTLLVPFLFRLDKIIGSNQKLINYDIVIVNI